MDGFDAGQAGEGGGCRGGEKREGRRGGRGRDGVGIAEVEHGRDGVGWRGRGRRWTVDGTGWTGGEEEPGQHGMLECRRQHALGWQSVGMTRVCGCSLRRGNPPPYPTHPPPYPTHAHCG
eukprot:357649-Chlamydomonas_euryale.AAC.3